MAKATTYYGTGRRKSSVARVFMTRHRLSISMISRSLLRAAAQPVRQARSATASHVRFARQMLNSDPL